jgi:CRP/FNR family transcriptional regulator, cyclic AMP receptor protein
MVRMESPTWPGAEGRDGGHFDAQVAGALRRSFLSALDPSESKALIQGAVRFDIPSGTIIYRDADRPRLALVLSGLMRVFMTSSEGRQITVRYAKHGDVLGVAVTVGGPVNVSVQAVTDAQVAMLDPAFLEAAARRDPAVAWAVAEELSRRLYETLDELAGNVFLPLRERIIRHLLDMAAESQTSDATTLAITQQDLADAVGSVREVVSRTLGDLRAAGLVETRRDGVTILDAEGLHAQLGA